MQRKTRVAKASCFSLHAGPQGSRAGMAAGGGRENRRSQGLKCECIALARLESAGGAVFCDAKSGGSWMWIGWFSWRCVVYASYTLQFIRMTGAARP